MNLIFQLQQHIIKVFSDIRRSYLQKKSVSTDEFAWLENLILSGTEEESTMLAACKAIAEITFPSISLIISEIT